MTEIMNLLFPVFTLIICFIALWRMYHDRRNCHTEKLHLSRKTYIVCLALIFLVAAAVRIYRFGAVPGGFNQDGAMAAVDAKALADYGTDRYGMQWPVHLTAWGYGQMSSLLSYLMIPFIKLFGLNPVTARLPLLVVSMMGLVVLYLFARDLFGNTAALIILFFGAINPWHILQSRWALDCNLYSHFFLFGVYFLNKSLRRKKVYLWLCLSMLMFGLCMYCYGISIYTMPFFLVVACSYLLISKKIRFTEALLCLFIWLAVSWPFITVMVINTFGLDTIETPLFTMAYFPDSVRAGDILFFSSNIPKQLLLNLRSLLEITLVQGEDLIWNNIPQYGTMYLFSMPFFFVGIIDLVKEHRGESSVVLLAVFFLTGVWCGLTTNEVNINRLNIIYYPIMIVTGFGIYKVIQQCPVPRLTLIVPAAYLIAFCLFTRVYFTTYAEQISISFEKGFCDAVASIRNTEAETIYITPKSNGKDSKTGNEIRVMFFHEIDAEYYQGKTCPDGMLPYADRYIYTNMSDIEIDPERNAVYVLPDTELEYFPEDEFTLQRYGFYYTAIPR